MGLNVDGCNIKRISPVFQYFVKFVRLSNETWTRYRVHICKVLVNNRNTKRKIFLTEL